MGWLTSFAVLMYLSFVCVPTPDVAHKNGFLWPNSFTLQAISTNQLQYIVQASVDSEEQPSAVLVSADNKAFDYLTIHLLKTNTRHFSHLFSRPHQPREPTVTSSPLILLV